MSAVLARRKLVATEDGLISRLGDEADFIRWDEARIFAVVSGSGPRQYTYELSSSVSKRVLWHEYPPDTRFEIVRPVLSYRDYERQMNSLLSVIAARAGLPLADLRKSRSNEL